MIDTLLEKNLVPDFMIRRGIRKLNRARLCSEEESLKQGSKENLIAELKQMPVAIETRAANDQHYEVPPEFFQTLSWQASEIQLLLLARRDRDS